VQGAASPVDLQIGPAGDLFYVDFTGGNVHRVKYAGGQPPYAVINGSPTAGAPPLTVAFDGSGSTDPDGTTLLYSWDLNGDGTFGDAMVPKPTYTYGVAGSYRASLRVTDADSLSNVASLTITVGNTPPTAVIDTPSATLRWHVGQSITFSGHAADEQQSTLPASALTWSLIMNHCSTPTSCHEHQIQAFQGVATGTFVAPDHEYPSYLTLRLTATDSDGLQTATIRRLDPQTVPITLQSAPTGLQIGFGSEIVATPSTRTLIVGSRFSLSAPSPQVVQGIPYDFTSWSDGGPQTHIAVAPTSPTTYTSGFRPAGSSDAGNRVLLAAAFLLTARRADAACRHCAGQLAFVAITPAPNLAFEQPSSFKRRFPVIVLVLVSSSTVPLARKSQSSPPSLPMKEMRYVMIAPCPFERRCNLAGLPSSSVNKRSPVPGSCLMILSKGSPSRLPSASVLATHHVPLAS
jgi:PKD domain